LTTSSRSIRPRHSRLSLALRHALSCPMNDRTLLPPVRRPNRVSVRAPRRLPEPLWAVALQFACPREIIRHDVRRRASTDADAAPCCPPKDHSHEDPDCFDAVRPDGPVRCPHRPSRGGRRLLRRSGFVLRAGGGLLHRHQGRPCPHEGGRRLLRQRLLHVRRCLLRLIGAAVIDHGRAARFTAGRPPFFVRPAPLVPDATGPRLKPCLRVPASRPPRRPSPSPSLGSPAFPADRSGGGSAGSGRSSCPSP
ncbi:MAG: hypothetical protein JWO31_2111, partial [Phycisphaerales bacterium]|nr:hypothetical protein [Phycisphaerales bacterium]